MVPPSAPCQPRLTATQVLNEHELGMARGTSGRHSSGSAPICLYSMSSLGLFSCISGVSGVRDRKSAARRDSEIDWLCDQDANYSRVVYRLHNLYSIVIY
jgi:hypothetical protein